MEKSREIYTEAFNSVFDILESTDNIFSEYKFPRNNIDVFYENFIETNKKKFYELSETKFKHLCETFVLFEVAMPVLLRVKLSQENLDAETNDRLELSLDLINKNFRAVTESAFGIAAGITAFIAIAKFLFPPIISKALDSIIDACAAVTKVPIKILTNPVSINSELSAKEIANLEDPKTFDAIVKQCTGLTNFNPNGIQAAGLIRLFNGNKIFEYRKCILSKLIDYYGDLIRALLATLRSRQMIEEMEYMAKMDSLSMNTFFQTALRAAKGDSEVFEFLKITNDVTIKFKEMIKLLQKEGGAYSSLANDLNKQFDRVVESVVKDADAYVKDEREKQEQLEAEEMERMSGTGVFKNSSRDNRKPAYKPFSKQQRPSRPPRTDSGFERSNFGSGRYNHRESNRQYMNDKYQKRYS